MLLLLILPLKRGRLTLLSESVPPFLIFCLQNGQLYFLFELSCTVIK
jgi:hypothetical protein